MSGVVGLSTMSKFFSGRRGPQNPQSTEPLDAKSFAGSKVGDGYNEDIRDAMNQVIALNAVKGALMEELTCLKEAHDRTVSKLVEKDSTEESLRQSVSKLKNEKKSLQDDLRASISKLESEKNSLASKIEETSRMLQQRTSVDEDKLKSAVEETSNLRRTISELQEEINATEFGHITAQLGYSEQNCFVVKTEEFYMCPVCVLHTCTVYCVPTFALLELITVAVRSWDTWNKSGRYT